MHDTSDNAPQASSPGAASAAPADLVLWLDLSEENQPSEASIREQVPPGAVILPLTGQGVARCPRGTPARWPQVIDAIDRLVHRARELERRSPSCRYWIAGRAGLPAFFHLGHRLGQMAAITFIHQSRNSDPVIALPLDRQRPGGPGDAAPAATYFARSPWPIARSESVDPVALVVSVLRPVADASVWQAFALARQGRVPAAIVRGHAEAPLDQGTLSSAMRELAELIRETSIAHPVRNTLAVFIAGPSSLAFLVGNAINPGVCRDVQVFEFEGDRYRLAYELPHPAVPERDCVLWLGASPQGTTQLALDEEIRAMRVGSGQGAAANRLQIVPIPAARPTDLLNELKNLGSRAVQFSGHGSPGGLEFQDEAGQRRPVEVVDLVELFRLASEPVRLAVIAACHSEAYAEDLSAHVDCVIAMRSRVDDTDALRFAAALYHSLGEGESVQVAFENARLAMRLARPARAGVPAPADEAPQLKERLPGVASTLCLVRRP